MMENTRPIEVFPPGDFIREELDARDWTQSELAEIMGRSPKEISDLVSGKRAVSPEIAVELEAALGPSAAYWLSLESSYRLWRHDSTDDSIARRARLRSLVPVQEMVRRHWIEESESVDVTEESVRRFLEISDLGQAPVLRHAARRSTVETTPAQLVWLYRARQLARTTQVKSYSPTAFAHALGELRGLVLSVPEVRHVPRILANAGVRFVVIEQFPKTKVDGAVFWLDQASPVVALSLRYDRVDYFWHTLIHELGHVRRKDASTPSEYVLDVDIVGQEITPDDDDAEREADAFATEFLVRQSELDSFITRVDPLYGKQKILSFAARLGVHPGIVVGQLQFRKKIPYSQFRPMLEKVRHIVTQSALTDGWGQHPPILV